VTYAREIFPQYSHKALTFFNPFIYYNLSTSETFSNICVV
jgi:hypothetical protein